MQHNRPVTQYHANQNQQQHIISTVLGFVTGLNTTEKYLEQLLGKKVSALQATERRQRDEVTRQLWWETKYLESQKITLCGSEFKYGFFGEGSFWWDGFGVFCLVLFFES